MEPKVMTLKKRGDREMTNSNIKLRTSTSEGRCERAVVFVRTRSLPYDAELDQARLVAQRRHCRQVAEALEAEVAREYGAIGGTAEPQVLQVIENLLKHVEGGGIAYLIVQQMDRLARGPKDMADIARRLRAAGTRLVTTAHPAERFLADISLFCLLESTSQRRSG
jgi:DNA invertase Pin-like site-specific DNA recombinase